MDIIDNYEKKLFLKNNPLCSKSSKEEPDTPSVKMGTTLIEEEKAALGGVKLGVYLYYVGCVGVSMTISSVLAYLAYTGFTVFSSIWLSIWSTDPDIDNRDKYLSVYGVLGVLQVN